MSKALAFLSYTRKDDEFFGGYITAFRKMLENAVHVVTGDTGFQVFQDIDGVAVGEQWQKKLSDALEQSSLFLPMLSPLFFSSKACMLEVGEFFEHERSLKRDDLVLPIYFLSSAKVEKEEERAKDPIAKELATRQRVDWRANVYTPLSKPAGRRAVVALAEKVAQALQRAETPPSLESLESPASPPSPRSSAQDAATKTRAPASRGIATKGVIGEVAGRDLGDDPRLIIDVPESRPPHQLGPLTVLWVDDRPDNNAWERRAFEDYGLRFTLARSTDEARQLLSGGTRFAAVISDMGRPEDRQAGLTLLRWVTTTSHRETPYFIYTSPLVAMTLSKMHEPGLRGITADPDVLVDMVLAAMG